MRQILTIWGLSVCAVFAQSTITGSKTIQGNWDASGATSTRPAKTGASLPATCASGEVFFSTAASSGQNIYVCNPANIWSQVAGGPGSGGGAGIIAERGLIFDGSTTLAGETMSSWSCSGATCSTAWTVPAGVNWVYVQMWAAGGGGSGSAAGGGVGGGGGGGGFWSGVCLASAGSAVTIGVGQGATGGRQNPWAADGGSSQFGSCMTVTGGLGGDLGVTEYGGTMGNANRLAWSDGTSFVLVRSFCALNNNPGGTAIRFDAGGCGAGGNSNAGVAGANGGDAPNGGGGGGGAGYNNASGGAGGVSALGNTLYVNGGNGGNGGGWTSAAGIAACGDGVAPGGGGGAAGVETAGANLPGCSGARGEVRVFYVH